MPTKTARLVTVLSAIFVSRLAAGADLDQQIMERQAEIAAAQAQLAPLLVPIIVSDADLRIWLSARIISVVTSAYNQQQDHTLHYQATSEQGRLKNSTGGALGCGWYVDVHNGNAAQADMTVNNITANWSSSGSEAMALNFIFGASAQIDGHVNGPAGPCSILHPWPTCDCPIGGGLGSSVGTSANKSGSFGGVISFTSSPTSWLLYTLAITTPSSIPLTIDVSLQHIGTIGIPTSIAVPNGVVTAGSAASVFSGSGAVKVGTPPILNKSYDVAVTPTSSVPDATGYAAKAKADVVFH